MKTKKYYVLILIVMGLITQHASAQADFNKQPNQDAENVKDEFQEHFFEALKQKGIENYDKAIVALQKCLTLNTKQPSIYFELGKNYNKLKNYTAAEDALKQAIAMQPDNEWFLDELYDVYFQQNNIDKAIETIKQLVKYHPDYKQDLATLYIREKKYKPALELLDQLDEELGTSDSRSAMRETIYSASGNTQNLIENLEKNILNDPNNEDNYLKLIYRYSQSGAEDKAYAIAKKLVQLNPNNKQVHLALYKFYLEDNKIQDAINSIKTALLSPDISADAKTKVLKDFVSFVSKNPEYESNLINITSLIETTKTAQNYEDLGQYYLKTGDTIKALSNFRAALKQDSTNFNLIKNVLLLEVELQNYTTVIKETNVALELYPAQPILYLLNGLANVNLNNYQDAINNLEMGLDFLIENPKMEIDFYSELSKAFRGINNISKSETFAKKAEALKSKL